MKALTLIFAILLCFGMKVSADPQAGEHNGPKRGLSQHQVEQQFGAPVAVKGPVGQPPITRWDYPGFSVYFEYQTVLHTVYTDQQSTQ